VVRLRQKRQFARLPQENYYNQRVERGLYVCDEHGDAFNADVNGAENIRLDISEKSNSESASRSDGNRSTDWLAQPGVYLYDLSRGFQPKAQVVDCKPSDPNARDSRVDETDGLVRTPELSNSVDGDSEPPPGYPDY
jgi:hypothetical protein